MILYYLLNQSQGTPRIGKLSLYKYSQSYDKDDILNLTRPCIFQRNMNINNNDHGHAISGQRYEIQILQIGFSFFFKNHKPIFAKPVNVFVRNSLNLVS